MFARKLKFRLICLQVLLSILIFGIVALVHWGLHLPLPSWAWFGGFVAVCAAAGYVSYLLIVQSLDLVRAAIQEIEKNVHDTGERMAIPSFSASTREILPEVTETIERALKRMRRTYAEIAGAAWTDSVTSLPNRSHFLELVNKYLPCPPDDECALLFLDLDKFKAVNDSLGHTEGDDLLRAFAHRIDRLLRGSDAVFARFAGDEFIILLPGKSGAQAAETIAARILDALNTPFRLGNHQLTIGTSIGICRAPEDGTDFELLMRNADTAMYRAKALGRNRAQTFEATMLDKARQRQELETCLRGASEAGQFVLHLQPQINCQSGHMVGAEALVRWNHPKRGLLPPKDFIEVAEETGIIIDVGSWVLEESLAMIGRLTDLRSDFRLSVNVSTRQMETSDFATVIENAIARHHVNPRHLEIEITESLVMKNAAEIVPKLAHLRDLGVSIAVDDFGTGYSNLARLKTLPIDRVKIDRSLVRDIALSGSARTIVQAIIGLVRGLGYQSVAEGVETTIQRDVLAVMGCDAIQGFGVARPMSEADFIAWSRDKASVLKTSSELGTIYRADKE